MRLQEATFEQINNPKSNKHKNTILHEEPYYILENHLDSYLKLGIKTTKPVEPIIELSNDNVVLTNGIYIFISLILVIILFGGLIFGIREYYLSFKNKVTSSEIIWHEKPQTNSTKGSSDTHIPTITDESKVETEKTPMESGLTQFEEINNENSQYEFNKFESMTPFSNKETQVINNFSSGFSDKSITKFIHKPKLIYSYQQLKSLNVVKDSLLTNKTKQKISMSKLLSCNIIIPRAKFVQEWKANETILQIRTILFNSPDQTEKSLALLKLISIGKTELLDNPNVFLQEFNNCIEEMVDSGTIFNLFNESNGNLPRLLMEMVLSYCWCHSRYYSCESKHHSLEQYFSNWRIKPIIQHELTILRILCNLQLGLFSSKEHNENELKLGLVIRELIKHSECSHFKQFVNMLIQAIISTNIERNKYFFYEILKILIMNHQQCCIFEYLRSSSDLRLILQYGVNQSKTISEKCHQILQLLLVHDETVSTWNNSPVSDNFITAIQQINSESTIPNINSWNVGILSSNSQLESGE